MRSSCTARTACYRGRCSSRPSASASPRATLRRWSKDPEVRTILKKVISDQISTPEIIFVKKDIDYLDGRRLSLELSLDNDPRLLSDTSAPARELTVGSARVNFQVVMTGENNEDGKKELALLS